MGISARVPAEIEAGRGDKVLNIIHHLYFTNHIKIILTKITYGMSIGGVGSLERVECVYYWVI